MDFVWFRVPFTIALSTLPLQLSANNAPTTSPGATLSALYKCAENLKSYDTVVSEVGSKVGSNRDVSFSFAGVEKEDIGLWQVYKKEGRVQACFHRLKNGDRSRVTHCGAQILSETKHGCFGAGDIGAREEVHAPGYCPKEPSASIRSVVVRSLGFAPEPSVGPSVGRRDCVTEISKDCASDHSFSLSYSLQHAGNSRVLFLKELMPEEANKNKNSMSFHTVVQVDQAAVIAFSRRIRNMLEVMMSPAIDDPRRGRGNLQEAYKLPKDQIDLCFQEIRNIQNPRLEGLKEHINRVRSLVHEKSGSRLQNREAPSGAIR